MSDNVAVTPGSGADIATDDTGATGHVQINKLAISTDGSATLIPADADGLLVNLGSNNDVTVTGSALTALQNIDTDATTIIGHLDGVETLLTAIDGHVDGLETLVGTTNTNTGNAATSLAILDDWDATAGSAHPSDGVMAMGSDGTNARRLKTDSSGELQVDVLSMPTVAVTQSGTWDEVGINDSGNSITVDQPTGTNLHTVIDSGTITLPTGASTSANQTTQIAAEQAIQTAVELIDDTVATLGTTTYSEATTKGLTIGAVRRDADTTLVNTTNEVGPLQMDANGRLKVEAFSGETLPVSLTSTTVTGTVAVTQSGTWDEVGINDSGNSITVDNGGTFAVQVDGSALTALQLIDNIVYTEGDTDSTITGVPILVETGSDVVGTVKDDSGFGENLASGIMSVHSRLWDGSAYDRQPGNSTDGALVNLGANNDVTVTSGAITETNSAAALTALQLIDNLAVAVDGNYLNVNMNVAGTDVVSGSGNATGALRVELPTNGTGVVGLNAGTAAVGKLLPPDTDVTAHTNYAKKYYTNSGAVTDGIIWSPAAGKRFHVVSMFINVSAAATVTLEDDKAGGDEAIWKAEFAANSGVAVNFGEKYPLASGEDAADLIITTSAGNVYVTCTGYEV